MSWGRLDDAERRESIHLILAAMQHLGRRQLMKNQLTEMLLKCIDYTHRKEVKKTHNSTHIEQTDTLGCCVG